MSPARIRIPQRVEWIDTDAAGIYHWGTVVRFADAAEAALHRALGIVAETFGATPRVSVAFTFLAPLCFGDVAAVELSVAHVGRSSVRYDLLVIAPDGADAVRGEIVSCLVDESGSRSRPWPDDVRRALLEGGELTEG